MRRAILGFIGLVLLLGAAAAPRAEAYGAAEHVALGRKAAALLASDPRYAFLATDEGLRNCFLYGAMFPDVRQAAAGAASIERLKRELEAKPFVREVRLSTLEVKALDYDTHDREFLLFLLDRAERSGSQAFLAFALGNVTHVPCDVHAQTMIVPHYMARTGAADVGPQAVLDPAVAAAWGPGTVCEGIVEGMIDVKLSRAEVLDVREVSRKLYTQGSALTRLQRGLQREVEVKHLYYLAAKEWHDVRLARSSFITERGFLNTAKLFDAAFTLYPFGLGKESAADAARVFKSRYIDLPWWADALSFVADAIIRVFTLGRRDVYDVLVAVAFPKAQLSAAFAAADPAAEIIYGFTHGGADEQAVRRKYANNVEFDRLLSSGLMTVATYATALDDGARMARDVILGRAGSRFALASLWPVWDNQILQAGAIGGLAKQVGAAGGFAVEPALLVAKVRIIDPSSGAAVTTLHDPTDVGRALRAEVELFAPVADPAIVAQGGRDVTLLVKSDKAAGAADPVAAQATQRLSLAQLTPSSYGAMPRPVFTLDFTAPADLGQAKLYIDLDAGRGTFFTTNLARLASATAGRPQYASGVYRAYPPSVGITR